jgi:hypothetical protein
MNNTITSQKELPDDTSLLIKEAFELDEVFYQKHSNKSRDKTPKNKKD